MSSVCPSAGAFATRAAPRLPPAPERLSTTTVCPSISPNAGPTMRAVMSTLPPGGYGTISRIGRPDCAVAAPDRSSSSAAARHDLFILLPARELDHAALLQVGDRLRAVAVFLQHLFGMHALIRGGRAH